jgi:hypothetical protein
LLLPPRLLPGLLPNLLPSTPPGQPTPSPHQLHHHRCPHQLRQHLLRWTIENHPPRPRTQFDVRNIQLTNIKYDLPRWVTSQLFSNTLIANLLAGNQSAAKQQVQDSAVQVALFIGPFLLGFIALLISAPFVCCCCVCPQSCPSRCCRKNEDEQYTNCELYWPTAILILGLLLAIGASIAGIFHDRQGFRNRR